MKSTLRAAALAAVLGMAAGCGGGSDAPSPLSDLDLPEEERYGGTAVIGSISDIPDLSPLTSTTALAADMQEWVLFLPVIHYDQRLQPIPALARSWEVNADSTALTFDLRDDVFWHDGVRTTAYDLAFAYEMANDPAVGFPNTAFWTHYGDGEAIDSFTFRVQMRPHAEFMDPWRTFSAVPRHILGEVPPAQMRLHPFGTRQPVGNGPFRFVSRIDGQSWTFEANPDFPEELGGRPYLDRLVYRSNLTPTTLLTELLTGRIDFYNAPLPPEQADRIASDANTRLLSYVDRAFVIMSWNQRRPPFDDVRVRRALTMAIDRQQIVDAVLYGYGSPANSTVPPFFWQYEADVGADLAYDPDQATALLEEAGFSRGADGMLRRPDGLPFVFTLNTNQGNQARADIAAIAQADLRRIGVDMRIQILEWGTLLDRINDPRQREFDAVLIGWRTEFRIDDSDLFHCDKQDAPYQWAGHCDPVLDALLDTLPLISDRNVAAPLWSEYQHRVSERQPYTFVYFEERLHGVHNRLRNVNPDPRGDWVGIDRWYIVPDQRGRGAGASAAAVPGPTTAEPGGTPMSGRGPSADPDGRVMEEPRG